MPGRQRRGDAAQQRPKQPVQSPDIYMGGGARTSGPIGPPSKSRGSNKLKQDYQNLRMNRPESRGTGVA